MTVDQWNEGVPEPVAGLRAFGRQSSYAVHVADVEVAVVVVEKSLQNIQSTAKALEPLIIKQQAGVIHSKKELRTAQR